MAVLIIQQFNAAAITDHFLTANNLVRPEELREDRIYTPVLVKTGTADYELLCLPDRAQMTFDGAVGNHERLIQNTLTRIVELLPNATVTAVGLNSLWRLEIPGVDLRDFTSREFLRQGSRLNQCFEDNTAVYGAIARRGFANGGVFGVEIRPEVPHGNAAPAVVLMNSNCHFDLTPENRNPIAVAGALNQWGNAMNLASQIANAMAGGQ